MNKVIAKPQLTINEALVEAKGKLLNFKGRSRRSEFWWCSLVAIATCVVLGWIPFIGFILSLVVGFLMIPLIFRRLHDTGHSGWWYGIALIIGVVVVGSTVGPMVAAFSDIATNPTADSNELVSGIIQALTNPVSIVSSLVNLILQIIVLVFCIQDSHVESNKYGDSPKYVIEG